MIFTIRNALIIIAVLATIGLVSLFGCCFALNKMDEEEQRTLNDYMDGEIR